MLSSRGAIARPRDNSAVVGYNPATIPLPMFLVTKEFTFDSAHFLPKYFGKCENLHGHTYKLHVTVHVSQLDDQGLAFDFVTLKEVVKREVVEVLDHKLINDIIPVSSAENIAAWAWEKLAPHLPLFELKLWETPTSFVTYRGPHGTF